MLSKTRPVPTAPPDWLDVSEGRPCPCRGATADCSFLAQAEFVHCRNTASLGRWPAAGGSTAGPPATRTALTTRSTKPAAPSPTTRGFGSVGVGSDGPVLSAGTSDSRTRKKSGRDRDPGTR
jgi:hypothetical protein